MYFTLYIYKKIIMINNTRYYVLKFYSILGITIEKHKLVDKKKNKNTYCFLDYIVYVSDIRDRFSGTLLI